MPRKARLDQPELGISTVELDCRQNLAQPTVSQSVDREGADRGCASPSKVGCFPVAVQRIFAIYFRQSETSFLIFVFIHSKADRINSSIFFMLHLPLDCLCCTGVFVSWGPCSGLNFRYRSHCSRPTPVSAPIDCVGFGLSYAVQIRSSRDKLNPLSVLPVFV